VRLHPANKEILDDCHRDLLTWIFRFGIPHPKSGNPGAVSICKEVDDELVFNSDCRLDPIPSETDLLVQAVCEFFDVSKESLKLFIPRLFAED
jgi:hypothetical protein